MVKIKNGQIVFTKVFVLTNLQLHVLPGVVK
jgi:hypothetical protein